MSTKTRLKEIMVALRVQPYQLATTCEGITKSMLQNLWNSETETVTTNILEPFCKRYPEVNCNWLLRGEGSMFLNTKGCSDECSNKLYEFCKMLLENKRQEDELYNNLAKLMSKE